MSTYSFSRCWSPKASAIVTSSHVSDEFDPTFDNGEHPTLLSVSQLWDTGAVRTMIARRIATKLNLRPIGMAIISMCDFVITNSGNQTKFSFRIPGTGSSDIQ